MKLKPRSRVKRTVELEPCMIMKKQRSNRSFQVRSQISPILICNTLTQKKNRGFSVDSISCCHFGDEVSSDSSRVTAESNLRKRKLEDDSPFRRITRSYYKHKERARSEFGVGVSESSCVEEEEEESNNSSIKGIQASYASNCSSLHQNLNSNKEIKEDDAVSVASGVESCLSHKTTTNRETELSEISKNDVVSANECVVEQDQKPNSLGGGEENEDLTCKEELYLDDGVSDYSSCQETLSELQSEIFPEKYSSDELDFSDGYTPSIFFESGSDFSEKSLGDSNPSQTYTLLLQFRQQFSRSSLPLETRKSSALLEAEYQENSSFSRFEDDEDEESYKRLRDRERRQLFLHDYPEFYRTTTEHGDLILQQRLQMVHWIIEQSTSKEFELTTMFLGISLLDRFLTKGFFTDQKHLQIVGIACLTLATRIEENQPYNCVRQKNFYIGNNVYGRCEVVAMEWLVQEVLNFQCFLPTIHNFMCLGSLIRSCPFPMVNVMFYLKAVKADAAVEKKARYLAVLALSDHEQLRHWPSTVAATLVILASLESDEIPYFGQVIEVHVRTKENDLHECIKGLEWLLQYLS